MKICCVPGCNIRYPLHCVPFTKKFRWNQWLKLCPFLLKYNYRQLEDIRICRHHFIPEHIDYEKRRLTEDSFPLLNLPGNKTKKTVKKGSKVLEINPIHSNESMNFKVISTSPELQTKNTFESPSTECSKEALHLGHLTSLNIDNANGLPVDHNMYCLPSRADKRPACLSSTLTLSPNVECNIKAEPVANSDTQPCTHIKEMEMLGAAARKTVSVAIQTDAVTEHLTFRPLPDLRSAHCEHSVMNNLKPKTVDNVYNLPPAPVADASAHREIQEQFDTYLRPQLSKSPLKRIVFLNDQCILPYDNVYIKSSQTKKNTPVSSSAEYNNPSRLCIQLPLMKPTASISQPSQGAMTRVQTLESLVAELVDSNEETAYSQPSPGMMATDTLSCPLNPTCTPTKVSPVREHLAHPALMSDKGTKGVCTDKENSTPNEQKLKMQNKTLKNKLRSANKKCKYLKLKLDKILGIAKPFLKACPRLTRETKALIDTQIRLAGVQPKAARYNEDEKLFAIRLYQMSPDCYRFLQQYLKLPCMSTMKTFLKNV